MKLKIICLWLISLNIYAFSLKPETVILANKLAKDIATAKSCLPHNSNGIIQFCTGTNLKLNDFIKISNNNIAFCFKKINELNYQIIKENAESKTNIDTWNSFYNSTKRAEAIHGLKSVYFKQQTNSNDCLHEYIHVLQWTSKTSNVLSPKNRKINFEKFSHQLEMEADRIKFLTDKKDLLVATQQLSEKVNLLNDYSNLIKWLDEKDVYWTLFKQCGQSIQCSLEDLDTIIANMIKLKEFFPFVAQKEINIAGTNRLKEKEQTVLSSIHYKNLSDEQIKAILNFSKLEMPEQLAFIKSKYAVYKFQLADTSPSTLKDFIRLPDMEKEQLLLLLSLKENGYSFSSGKFICNKDRPPFFLITNISDIESITRELVFSYQTINNKELCSLSENQKQLESDFKNGKIPRYEFEEHLLRHKLYTLLAKKEAELFYINQHWFNLTQLQLSYLSTLAQLSVQTGDLENKEYQFNNPLITLTEVDDLPIVKVNNEDFIWDLGSMNSVITPNILFKLYSFDKIIPITSLKQKNALNVSSEVLQISTNEVTKIDANEIKDVKWLVKDLRLKFARGVIGIDLFKNKDFIIYPKDKKIVLKENLKSDAPKFLLEKDNYNSISSLEFYCTKGLKVRIDTGSQIWGDLSKSLSPKIQNQLHSSQGVRCKNILLNGTFHNDIQNETIFANNVKINLGWPWLKQFTTIYISLKDQWISFKK